MAEMSLGEHFVNIVAGVSGLFLGLGALSVHIGDVFAKIPFVGAWSIALNDIGIAGKASTLGMVVLVAASVGLVYFGLVKPYFMKK